MKPGSSAPTLGVRLASLALDDAARVILAVLKQLDCESPLWGTYHYGGHEASTSLSLGQAVLSEARHYRSNLVEDVAPQAHAAPARGGLASCSVFLKSETVEVVANHLRGPPKESRNAQSTAC